jgi:hypothetical protein
MGADGNPLHSRFRNGKLCATLRTGIKLSELSLRLSALSPVTSTSYGFTTIRSVLIRCRVTTRPGRIR